ncbi:SRPBCC domain-containing protein [Sinomonas sp. G460-2]|uniref:SRPBCC domain-containing protein n=1 Tax=Sinomonas sp. G460-2 TaxID=3393464 RepID=UPI0039EF1F9E
MEPLFSHGSRPEPSEEGHATLPPRVYRLAVPAPREIAFSAFVGDIHLWWPDSYTGFGATTHAYVEDGIIGEESELGESQVWGEVRAEEPPSFVEFSWTLAWRPDAPTRVRVEFDDDPESGEGTLVTFTHDGWARGPEGRDQYEKYSEWPLILGRYAAYFGVPADTVETVE